jgi:hypothetical protein
MIIYRIMNDTLWVIVITSLFCIILLVIVVGMYLQKTPIAYYPIIQLSSYGSGEIQPYNNGLARAIIQSSSLYPVPTGFTFLSNWSFNPLKIGGDIILDQNETTATVSNSSGWGIIVGKKALQGKVMYSVSMTYPGYQPDANAIGIGSGLFSPFISYAHTIYIGSTTQGIAVYDTGSVSYNNSILFTGDSFAKQNGTNIVDIAVDTMAKLYWYRVDGGNWNSNSESHPATGSGGWSIKSITN